MNTVQFVASIAALVNVAVAAVLSLAGRDAYPALIVALLCVICMRLWEHDQ
jgi:hypothetical protein